MDGDQREAGRLLCLAVDNRIFPQMDYHREALMSSFQQYFCEVVAKVFMFSNQHQWLPRRTQVFCASSSSTMAPTSISNTTDLSQIYKALEPRFTFPEGTSRIKSTWSDYLSSGLLAVSRAASLSPSPNGVSIVFYSTDISLFGDTNQVQCHGEDSIDRFLTNVSECIQRHENVDIRIAIGRTDLSDIPNESLEMSSSYVHLIREIQRRNLPVRVSPVMISTLHFDHELRTVLGDMVPLHVAKLTLDHTENPCSIFMSLKPYSLGGADCLQFMADMEVCGFCHRVGLNPLFLAGFGMEVSAPEKDQTQNEFDDQQTLFFSMRDWLSARDLVLIIKVPFIPQGQSKACAKFWALIPPEKGVDGAQLQQNMALILLNDRDQLLNYSEGQGSSYGSTINQDLFDQFQSLLSSIFHLPSVDPVYNPWLHISGSMNAQFEVHRRSLVQSKSSSILQPVVTNIVKASSEVVPTTKSALSSHSLIPPLNQPKTAGKIPPQPVREAAPKGRGRGKAAVSPTTQTNNSAGRGKARGNATKAFTASVVPPVVPLSDDDLDDHDLFHGDNPRPRFLKRKYGRISEKKESF